MYYHLLGSHLIAYLVQIHYSLGQAQTPQSILWNVPNGNLPDFSQTFTTGTTVLVSWNGWVYANYIDAETALVDLWVTAFDYGANPFNELLIENINLTIPGTFAWTIAIPDSSLATDPHYVLRFEPNDASTYNPNNPQLSSPGILIVEAAASSTSISTSSSAIATSQSSPSTISQTSQTSLTSLTSLTSSTSSTSSTTAAILSTSSTVTSTPTPSLGSSSSLSTGAAGGIGAGVALAVLGLIGIAYFVFKRKRSKNKTNENLNMQQPMYDMTLGQETHRYTGFPVEIGQGNHGSGRLPNELAAGLY